MRPSALCAHLWQGLLCHHRYSQAKNVLQHSISVKDVPHAHWLLGDAMFELGELSQAETHYNAAQTNTATKAERMHALQQLLCIYKKRGDSKSAADCTFQLQGLHG